MRLAPPSVACRGSRRAARLPRVGGAMKTRDLRVEGYRPLSPPAILLDELPLSETGSRTVASAREELVRILDREDDRLIVVVGPCSVHDVEAAIDYARRLATVATDLAADLRIVMRVYFEKPRTTVGWKGLINDPGLDGSFRINDRLRLARRLLLDPAEPRVPARATHHRREPREQRAGSPAAGRRRGRRRGADRRGRARDRGRDDRELPRRRATGADRPLAPGLRAEHHRRVHRMGRNGDGAPGARVGGARTPLARRGSARSGRVHQAVTETARGLDGDLGHGGVFQLLT